MYIPHQNFWPIVQLFAWSSGLTERGLRSSGVLFFGFLISLLFLISF